MAWAAGGCRGEPCPVPEGLMQARLAVRAALTGERSRFVHEHVVRTVAIDPEVASVGLSLEQAEREGGFIPTNLPRKGSKFVTGMPGGVGL